MKKIIDLSDKKILITGGSSGIGASTAKLCSQLGAKVILIARREEKLKEVLESLEGREKHSYYVFDLACVNEIEGLVKRIVNENGSCDGFVHSAGISCRRPLKLTTPGIMHGLLDINLISFIEIARCITKRGAYNEKLSIVGISSVSSIMGNKAKIAYSVSKAGMDAAIRCIAKELGEKGVRANTVCPGMIRTEIYEQYKSETGNSNDSSSVLERQYLGIGKPEDVANMVAFLLSDASSMITGSSIGVDGGLLSS